jgi:NAD+ kinase
LYFKSATLYNSFGCDKNLKRVGVFINKDKDIGYFYTGMIIDKLLNRGFTPVVTPKVKAHVRTDAVSEDNIFKHSDFIICVGGDGTFLKAAREAYLYRVPVLGINRGSVGFLAEVETRDIQWAIDRMAEGNVKIQPRMVIQARVVRDGETVFDDIAINDAVVSRIALSRILNLKVSLDDKYMDSFPGDGIIVATPTGSTGYSLSAGGPIVQPDVRLMVISPICPHILYSRSYIASEDKAVRICIDDTGEISAMLTLDGQAGVALLPGDLVEVRAAPGNVLFASVCNVNFYDVLRAKIHGKIE